MRIARVRIENYRSIEQLEITDLDKRQFVVIEGANDVGKSNIVEAIDLAFRAAARNIQQGAVSPYPEAWDDRRRRSCFRDPTIPIKCLVEVRTMGSSESQVSGQPTLTIEVSWPPGQTGEPEGKARIGYEPGSKPDSGVGEGAVLHGFRLVGTSRAPQPGYLSVGGAGADRNKRWLGDNLKQLLFLYKNSPEPEVEYRYEVLRQQLAALTDFPIGQIYVSLDPVATRALVRTKQNGLELDLEDRGTGVQQFITLAALAICHRGRILAIEEPELNLRESAQRVFWRMLREVIGTGQFIDQVFVTSHSRVFEEEADRLVVTRDGLAGTQAHWAGPRPEAPMGWETVHLTSGSSITLSDSVRNRLGVTSGEDLYVMPDRPRAVRIMGSNGYRDYLREPDDGDSGDV